MISYQENWWKRKPLLEEEPGRQAAKGSFHPCSGCTPASPSHWWRSSPGGWFLPLVRSILLVLRNSLGCLLSASYHFCHMDSPTTSGCQGTCCTSNVGEVWHLGEMLSGPYIGPSACCCTSRWTCSSSLRSSPPLSLPPCWLHSAAGCLPWWRCAWMNSWEGREAVNRNTHKMRHKMMGSHTSITCLKQSSCCIFCSSIGHLYAFNTQPRKLGRLKTEKSAGAALHWL